jgi:hypothetical protein
MFLIQVYLGSKCCPSLLETVGLQVPAQFIKEVLISMYAFLGKIFLLLDACQLLMLVGILT